MDEGWDSSQEGDWLEEERRNPASGAAQFEDDGSVDSALDSSALECWTADVSEEAFQLGRAVRRNRGGRVDLEAVALGWLCGAALE